ncbi:glycerate kinase [Flagellimonas algicola]|uniref:Glycerate kinase n=1 Tax=Flagellimonas algicola TaxID=2583815 RepID=A0ABY2WJL6_9FLAO|nr:glycerate kinase [Allomuricauda algicola]TMU54751.1 glycerate kinase [Allomuricauda algicola]
MKFVIAPDKYKGSLTGSQFCEAVENGIRRVFPQAQILKKPLADGGDGTLEVVQDYLRASLETIKVKDPLFRDIEAGYLLSKDKKTAYIEMSEASGYKLLRKEEMNCMHTTTLGTGQLLMDAVTKGALNIVLGIGGSATNDGGMGMASALGYAFLDTDGNRLQPVGKNLIHVNHVVDDKTSSLLEKVQVKVACDVNNPLYGKNGAAHVYGAQKGASPEEIEMLDRGLENFANVLQSHFGKDVRDVPGSGAAGGMGAGAMTFLNAQLVSGVDLVLEMADFDLVLKDADWLITGEGQLDKQTAAGKTIAGVVKTAKAAGVPVAALCGSVNASIQQIQEMGLDYAVSVLNQVGSLEDAKANSFSNLEQASFNFAKLLKVR